MNRLEMTKRKQRLTEISTTEGNNVCPREPKNLSTQESQKSSEERKDIKWKRLPEGLYLIFFDGGGETPAELSGTWTSLNKLLAAVEIYRTKRGY